jgi:hypothetical protein
MLGNGSTEWVADRGARRLLDSAWTPLFCSDLPFKPRLLLEMGPQGHFWRIQGGLDGSHMTCAILPVGTCLAARRHAGSARTQAGAQSPGARRFIFELGSAGAPNVHVNPTPPHRSPRRALMGRRPRAWVAPSSEGVALGTAPSSHEGPSWASVGRCGVDVHVGQVMSGYQERKAAAIAEQRQWEREHYGPPPAEARILPQKLAGTLSSRPPAAPSSDMGLGAAGGRDEKSAGKFLKENPQASAAAAASSASTAWLGAAAASSGGEPPQDHSFVSPFGFLELFNSISCCRSFHYGGLDGRSCS